MKFDPVQAIADFVRFPSVSTDSAFAAGMEGARQYIAGLLRDLGLQVEIIPTQRHAIVMATRDGPAHWPHVVIYGHYDVQPPDPLDLWQTPAFEPSIRDGRMYGRGTADNKGPMMVHIAAVARLLERDPGLPLRLTFLIEGEEEIGSQSFPAVLRAYRERLQGDFVLLSDTLSPSTDQIALTTALRGLVSLEVTLDGPASDLHSGIHGGAVYNPIQALAELCASLHDADNRVTVPGFYDEVVEAVAWERDEIRKLGDDPTAYAQQIGVRGFHPHPGYNPFEATRLLPTLEFNGIGGGYQGEGEKTIVPARATVKITCRLVANQDPETIYQRVAAAIEARVPPQVRLTIRRGHFGPPYQVVPPGRSNTPADQNPHLATAFNAAAAAITDVFGKPPLYMREGGSIPIIGSIRSILGMDSVLLGMFTPVDNLHAPNESFDLAMFQRGIDVSERILAAVAGRPVAQ
jgi:acetylornithine deacetylase/succinyl-diaminopimelate desuccinylase-like protein